MIPVIVAIIALLLIAYKKGINSLPIAGFFLGCVVWFYDYEFLLNAGGPEAQISNFICTQLGSHMCSDREPQLFIPLFVLILSGGAVGILLWILFYSASKFLRTTSTK